MRSRKKIVLAKKRVVSFEFHRWDTTCYMINLSRQTVTFTVRILSQMQRERW